MWCNIYICIKQCYMSAVICIFSVVWLFTPRILSSNIVCNKPVAQELNGNERYNWRRNWNVWNKLESVHNLCWGGLCWYLNCSLPIFCRLLDIRSDFRLPSALCDIMQTMVNSLSDCLSNRYSLSGRSLWDLQGVPL